MATTRYTLRKPLALSPWRDLEDVSNGLARLFNDAPRAGGDHGSWMPSVNVEEMADELVLSAELPGLSEEDISIELENNRLTISGEKSEQRTEGDDERRYHLWERRYGSFKRSFTLPRTVSGEDIRAHFDRGILTIHIPKAAEAKSRTITIAKA